MFDSNYTANCSLPIQSIHHPFDDHLLNPFHSHLLNDNELFLQDNTLPYHPSTPQLPPPTTKELTGEHNSGEKMAVRKGGRGSKSRKTGKTDRHSKIQTVQGPRDRRVRLSLQIARKFFDLQDMLGFDKASKTIEWLFNRSKAAIKEITDKSNFIPSSPLGEIIEGEKIKKKGGKNNKKGIILSEKRKEARARARERTQEKLQMQKQEQPLEEQMAFVGIIEKFLAGTTSLDHCEDDIFSMEFPENDFTEIGVRINNNGGEYGNMEILNSEYTWQLQGPNCAFNQGY